MSRPNGIGDEVLSLIESNPGKTASELFDLSSMAEKKEQVYQALHRIRKAGHAEKIGTGYRITKAGLEVLSAAPGDGLGWGSSQPKPKPKEPARHVETATPAANPDSHDREPAEPDPMFREFLSALLEACRNEASPALQVLADRVERHRPEGL